MNPRVVVGISGASGGAIGVRVVELLAEMGADIDLVVSAGAERTIEMEMGVEALDRIAALPARHHEADNLGAAIASGSMATAGMIVAPCSMRTLSAIAYSFSHNLLVRAADVHLKERRPLVLLVRETPLHLGHLKAMMAVAEMGAVVMPPVPALYRQPSSIDDVIDQIARRAIDLLRVAIPTATARQG
jgi:4-hydroxy-3-polyprenylbenzoate decarboxylase